MVFILISSFVGILVTVLLALFATKYFKPNVFLVCAFFIFSFFSVVISSLLFHLNITLNLVSLPLLNSLSLLTGPLLYFYVRGFQKNSNQLYLSDFWHLIPSILTFINYWPFYRLSFDAKWAYFERVQDNAVLIFQMDHLWFNMEQGFIFRSTHSLIYTIICIGMYLRLKNENYFEREKHFVSELWLKWMFGFLFCIFFSAVLHRIYLLLQANRIISLDVYVNWLSVPAVSFVIFNSSVLFFPKVLFGDYFYEIDQIKVPKKEPVLKRIEYEQGYFDELHEKFEVYAMGKPCLKTGFTLSDISKNLGYPTHQISLYFKNHRGVPFNTWKNEMRIKHAVYLIESGQAINLTLESIAFSCGYRSRTNFIEAFKLQTGKLPSEYLSSLH
jgi:AraC-like DNA-binding protein